MGKPYPARSRRRGPCQRETSTGERNTSTHTEPGHRSLEVGSFEILFEVLRIGGGVPGVQICQQTRERYHVCLGTHIQVQTSGSALRGMPPPSSEILIVMSCQWARVGQTPYSEADHTQLAHLRTLGHDDFDRRVVLAVDAVRLDDRSERILQDFKEYMVLDAHPQGESVIVKTVKTTG